MGCLIKGITMFLVLALIVIVVVFILFGMSMVVIFNTIVDNAFPVLFYGGIVVGLTYLGVKDLTENL